MLFSESDILDTLGASVTLEYVRDSPMFRQNITVFEDSFLQLNTFCGSVTAALSELSSALVGLEHAQAKVVAALTKQPGYVSRSLFTNALPGLTDLSTTLQTMSAVLSTLNKGYESIRSQIGHTVEAMNDLGRQDLSREKQLHQRMLTNYAHYETLLGNSLQSRALLNPAQVRFIPIFTV
jgi:hypothetical protein